VKREVYKNVMSIIAGIASVGFEVFTAVAVKNTTTFWDMTPCSMAEVLLVPDSTSSYPRMQ
jgi:hypothetical protein